jgi:hypothetical protein
VLQFQAWNDHGVYVLHDDKTLWVEATPWGANTQQLDSNVDAFQGIDLHTRQVLNVVPYVLKGQTLFLTGTPIDGNVYQFQVVP